MEPVPTPHTGEPEPSATRPPAPAPAAEAGPSGPKPKRLAMLGFVLTFALAFAAMQGIYQGGRALGKTEPLIELLITRPCVYWLRTLAPEDGVRRDGNRIHGPNVHLVVVHGCDGAGGIMLLSAALLAFPLPWRRKLLGILCGVLFMWGVNQVRIVGLYFVEKHRPDLFDALHEYAGETLGVMAGAIFFLLWISFFGPREQPCDATPSASS